MTNENDNKLGVVPRGEINPKSIYILGCDPSRTGKDETAIVILEQLPFQTCIFVSHLEIVNTTDLMVVRDRIIYLNGFYNFKKIILDETGLGAGLSDLLKRELGNKVEGIWYTQKSKVEMFNNMKLLMMQKDTRLLIPDYLTMNQAIVKKFFYQLMSITQNFSEDNPSRLPKISHEKRTHDDLVNACACACMYFKVGKKKSKGYTILGFNHFK